MAAFALLASALADASCAADPYLSVVLASRDDDYAGRMAERFVTAIALLAHAILLRCVADVEILVVEWNSPAERPGLGPQIDEALSIATSNSTCAETVKIRRIVVPPAVHSTLESHGHVRSTAPMSEFIAKNVGLRHARGKFVLAQNPDDVWSPALATFLLERRDHREDTFYTAGMRFDTALPERPTDAASALAEIVERAHDDERLAASVYAPTRPHRPEAFEQAVAAFGRLCEHGDDGSGAIPGYWDFHAGDFVLAARAQWEAVLAYPEVPWSFGIDSAILCKFYGAGLRNACLLPPCTVVHQFHEIRVNQNAVRVVDSNAVCEQLKAAPGEAIHESQREPDEWGRLEAVEHRHCVGECR